MQDLTLNTRMTQEDWDKLMDVEMENTRTVTFSTPSGKEVKYIPLSVLQEIRKEIVYYHPRLYPLIDHKDAFLKLDDILRIIDRKIEEMEKGEKDGRNRD